MLFFLFYIGLFNGRKQLELEREYEMLYSFIASRKKKCFICISGVKNYLTYLSRSDVTSIYSAGEIVTF